MDMKKLFLVFAILSLSLVQFSTLVHAQDDPVENWYQKNPDAQWLFEDFIGLTDNEVSVNGILYKFLIPFIGIWAIVLGFLRVIRIFETETRIELVISLVVAFMSIPTGFLRAMVNFAFAAMGAWASILFFGLFFVGTLAYSLVKGRGFWGTFGWGAGGVFDRGGAKEDALIDKKLKEIENQKIAIKEDIKKNKPTANKERTLRKYEFQLEQLKKARRWAARAA